MSTFYRLYFRKELICELCEYRSKWSNSTSQRNHLKTFHKVTKPLKKTFECYICYLKATSIEGCPKPVLFYSDEGMNYSLFYYLCPTSYFLHQIKIVFIRKLSRIKNPLLLWWKIKVRNFIFQQSTSLYWSIHFRIFIN